MVIHLITRLALGGAQQQVIQIASDFTNQKKETLIITGLSDSKSLSANDNKLLKLGISKNIKIEIIKELSDRISLFKDIISIIKIIKLLKKYNPKILHIHSSKTGVLGRLIKIFFKKIKIIYHVHGWSFSRTDGIKAKLTFSLEKFLYRFTDRYIFVCLQDMLDFIKLGGNKNIEHKSEVIYPGTEFIDKAEIYEHKTKLRKSLGLDCDDLVIGTIGRVDFQKNPEKFVEIAKNFVSINKKSKFLWIGKGSLKDKVMNLIDEYNLKNHVIFTGFVDDVELYFSIFDIFILTSRYEGLPITIIKALSLGIPVVSFKINGVNDLTTKYNSVFGARPFETDSFIEKLKDCIFYMENNSKNESLLIRKDFSNQKMLDNINELYSKLYFKNNL